MRLDKNIKNFLIGGVIGTGLLFIYEIIIIVLSFNLGLTALVLAWYPLLLFAFVTNSLLLNIALLLILIFIISGVINLIYQRYKK